MFSTKARPSDHERRGHAFCFADHELLFSLGLHYALNAPVVGERGVPGHSTCFDSEPAFSVRDEHQIQGLLALRCETPGIAKGDDEVKR